MIILHFKPRTLLRARFVLTTYSRLPLTFMENAMTLARLQTIATVHTTLIARMDFSYKHKVPYSTLARCIREGKIELHLIDGKIQIIEEEALAVTSKIVRRHRHDLFA